MLKDGGRLVYSTCSLNPLENEAVVMAAIARFKGRVSLVSASDQLDKHGLNSARGVHTWKVPILGKKPTRAQPDEAGGAKAEADGERNAAVVAAAAGAAAGGGGRWVHLPS